MKGKYEQLCCPMFNSESGIGNLFNNFNELIGNVVCRYIAVVGFRHRTKTLIELRYANFLSLFGFT